MRETEVPAAIRRVRDRIAVGPAPVSEIVRRGQRAQRKSRIAQVVMAAAAVVIVLSGAVVIPKVWDGSGTADSAPSATLKVLRGADRSGPSLLPSEQARKLCRAASGTRAEVLQAFLTNVKAVRHRTGGPPPGFSPAAKPWASLPADAHAAWCTVKSGGIYTVGAAGPEGEWVEFVVGDASVGTGPRGPAIP